MYTKAIWKSSQKEWQQTEFNQIHLNVKSQNGQIQSGICNTNRDRSGAGWSNGGGSGFEFWKPIRSACQADRKKLVSEVAGKSEAVQAATQRAKELTEPWKVARFIG